MALISPISAETASVHLHAARDTVMVDYRNTFDVLILDDDTFEQRRLERQLRATGLPVTTVTTTTADEFALALDQKTFDIVLIDYLLPDSDGLSAQRLVQDHDVNRAASVVMMSNQMRTDVAIKSTKLGSLDCLDKGQLDTIKLRELMMTSVRVLAEASRHWIGDLLEQQRARIASDVAKLVRNEMEFGRLIDTIDTRVLDMLQARGLTQPDKWDVDTIIDPDPPFAFR